MKKNQVLLAAILVLLSIGSTLQGAGFAGILSKAEGGGTVNYIHNKYNEIVIDDLSYIFSSTLVVRSEKGEMLGGVAMLGEGKRIAFKTALKYMGGKRVRTIVEVWILPTNFRIPEEWQ